MAGIRAQGQVMPTPHDIRGRTTSNAWLSAVDFVSRQPERATFHLVTRVAEPAEEVASIRQLADGVMKVLKFQPIDTVRNTIFPLATADRFPEPVDLAAHYRKHYPVIRRFKPNNRGTYFGRLVALPSRGGDTIDQLKITIDKLRQRKRNMTSRYELNIYLAEEDRNIAMGFPCMSSCALHLDRDTLHMLATYRNQYLMERGYGNYLGLGQLLRYICQATGLGVGELLVVAGHAVIDKGSRSQIDELLRAASQGDR